VGALWGAASYALLWGYTSIVITRRFVDSPMGLLSLLPARLVLYAIHYAENVAGHPFNFSNNHGWIGFVATLTGATILAAPTLVARGIGRRIRQPRRRGS
jgi:hypothetical protein